MLTEKAIKNAKPRDKPVKMFDERGLFLLLNPNGSKWWRLKYRFDGRERGISLGVYPEVSLAQARDRRDEARKLIANNTDPSVKRQAEKILQEHRFESIAREWLGMQEKKLAPVTLAKARWMLETFIYPRLGSRPIKKIEPPELLAEMRKIEAHGHHETAHRTMQRCGQVFRYAIATGRAQRDITADLRGALAPVVSENHAAITDPVRIGELMRAIDGYEGQPTTAAALKLAALTFVRPGELRNAEWSEFDLDKAEWRIPGEKMKMGDEHVVPLARQAIEVLRELHPLTGAGTYVFPSLLDQRRPMSENTVNAALRRLGYTNDEMTGHGFRALAATALNELGQDPAIIELQLAHAERNKVKAAYVRAQRLADRRKLMQVWADHLGALRAGGNVIPLKRSA